MSRAGRPKSQAGLFVGLAVELGVPPVVPDTISIAVERHQELLEKERASDAALYAFRDIQSIYKPLRFQDTTREYVRGYIDAGKDYSEAISRFVAAHPTVVAGPATIDDLPF